MEILQEVIPRLSLVKVENNIKPNGSLEQANLAGKGLHRDGVAVQQEEEHQPVAEVLQVLKIRRLLQVGKSLLQVHNSLDHVYNGVNCEAADQIVQVPGITLV